MPRLLTLRFCFCGTTLGTKICINQCCSEKQDHQAIENPLTYAHIQTLMHVQLFKDKCILMHDHAYMNTYVCVCIQRYLFYGVGLCKLWGCKPENYRIGRQSEAYHISKNVANLRQDFFFLQENVFVLQLIAWEPPSL